MNSHSGMSLENIYLKLVLLMIFLSVLLPSQEIFGIPVKPGAIIMVFCAFILILIGRKNIQVHFNQRLFVYVISMGVILTFFLVSLTGDVKSEYVIADFKSILLTCLFFIFADFAVSLNRVSSEEMLSRVLVMVFYGMLIFCAFKTILVMLLLFGVIKFRFVSDVIYPIINYVPVGMSIELIGTRFSFTTQDFLSVIIFLLLLYCPDRIKVNKIMQYLYYAFFAISLLSAYSRLLFGVVVLFTPIVFIFKKDYKKLAYLCIFVFIVAALNWETILRIFEHRFVSQDRSDDARGDMLFYLSMYWNANPIFGMGYGSYVPWVTRSEIMPYTYELQLLSLFMRLGVFPLLLILYLNITILYFIVRYKSTMVVLGFLLFNLLLLSAMTNQYLFNSCTNVTLLIIYYFIKTGVEIENKKILC